MQSKMASTQKADMPQLPATELDALETLFHGADANADGVVDWAEFKKVMDLLAERTGKRYNALQLRALFRIADLDGSGSIDFNELLLAQRRMQKSWGVAKAATFLSMAMKSTTKKPDAASDNDAERR